MMIKIKEVKDKKSAKRVSDFLLSKDAFEHTWAPGEYDIVKKAPLASLEEKNHVYWYIEEKDKVIAALGIAENEYKSGGYFLDYFSVHKRYRRRGLGSSLLKTAENFIGKRKGRYLIIDSCDTDFYKPARGFYKKHGYKKTGYVPDYYVVGEGKIDYYKKFR